MEAPFAVISPGSRNAPIMFHLHYGDKKCYSIIDERSAAFVALGIAKAKNIPVILNCTSGTAVLNYYPAIAEAYYARIPLIVLTADRPPEKIDTWDGQAIRQKGVFANHIRAEFETPDTYENETDFAVIAQKVNAYFEHNIPGPVHINVPIREPFYGDLQPKEETHRNTSESPNRKATISLRLLQEEIGENFLGKDILIFNGMQSGEEVAVKVDCLAWQTVEISDITANKTGELLNWDAFLYGHIKSNFEQLEILKPEILITTGTTTVSKALKQFLKKHKPEKHLHLSHYTEVGAMFETQAAVISPSDKNAYNSDNMLVGMAMWSPYKKAWVEKLAAYETIFETLAWQDFNEFSAVRNCLKNLPDNSILHLANSMAIRYASYLQQELASKNITIRSNRGTSGIDGCTSTAVGEALTTDKPVFLLIGDLAFLYDVNALWNENLPPNLKIIVLNNQGGGIFNKISGPEKMLDAQRLQNTPQATSISRVASAYNLKYYCARNFIKLERKFAKICACNKTCLLEIAPDNDETSKFYASFGQL